MRLIDLLLKNIAWKSLSIFPVYFAMNFVQNIIYVCTVTLTDENIIWANNYSKARFDISVGKA